MTEREPLPHEKLQRKVDELNQEIGGLQKSITERVHSLPPPENIVFTIQKRKEIARRETDTWWIDAMDQAGIDPELILSIEKKKQENQDFRQLENSFNSNRTVTPPHERKRKKRK